jgi:ASPIC and UnbV
VGGGEAVEARRVVVTWPDGEATRMDDVAGNQRLLAERPQ